MTTATKWVGVLGTWGWSRARRGWWAHDSPFSAYLRTQGLTPAREGHPFVWTGDVDGVPIVAGNDWEVGAIWLGDYLAALPYDDRNVIAHSHGGQLALIAATTVPLRSLILVATPVRKAIEETVAPTAVGNIGECLHLSDARMDVIGWAGALLDGRWSLRRTFDVDGIRCEQVRGMGHSRLLTDPAAFRLWDEHGWLDVLRGQAVV